MKARTDGRREPLVSRLLIRAYPGEFRAEYGPELSAVFQAMHDNVRGDGRAARAKVWLRIILDTARAAPLERWRAWRSLSLRRGRAVLRPDYAAASVAGAAVFFLYWLTLAPTAAFWDAGEYITVAHVMGIAHPPGNPLFVMLARAWDVVLSPSGWTTAVRINVLGAACSAVAHLFLYLCIDRALNESGASRMMRRVGAGCAVVLSATAFTVWSQSNVHEKVYPLSFATTMGIVWLALRWRDTGNVRLAVLALYLTALSATNHLMGILVLPAVVLFAWKVDRRVFLDLRLWAGAFPAVVLALSAQFFLPVRAELQPLVSEGEPTCDSLTSAAVSIYTNGARGCEALSHTLSREQYGMPPMWSDPTQPDQRRGIRQAVLQLANYAQYLDWQWARSVAGHSPLFGGARPLITLLLLLLAGAGARAHWRADRPAALLHTVLLATLSIGLVAYLNFKYGYSMERARFPDASMHEVRERDYFFLISFSLIGAWCGLGLATAWQAVARRLEGARTSHTLARLLAAPLLLCALIPLALNWSWASRADDWTARDWAFNVLMSVEPYGVLVTNGDNDSFPLWYLQHVERVREDVTIVLGPYIGAEWYARQIRDASRSCGPGEDPAADPTRIICQRPFRPDSVHPRLLAAWGTLPDVPLDTLLPLSDPEIAAVARSYFVADQALDVTAGSLSGRIEPGTFITAADTFITAILHGTYGKRPIHFMAPSQTLARLGLEQYAVRVGLTWKLDAERTRDGIVNLPAELSTSAAGAAIDLPVTDTLARDVFIVRGRVSDPDLPWVDHTTWSIPLQYATMHYAAAVAHQLYGAADTAAEHVRSMEFWERFVGP
ncbi:MAG: DUF2723 domain-containing protein [Gemmatimonadota bacterium]